MIDKKEFLLESIIKAYIINLEPIGSTQLKQMYDLEYSSATIRGYFKKLGDEGYLVQEHISSGRVPSYVALQDYWHSNISLDVLDVDYQALRYIAQDMGLSVVLKKDLISTLQQVEQFDSKYILLKFDNFAISTKYSSALYKFIQDMIGFEMGQIISISKQVGAYDLYTELSNKSNQNSYETINFKEYLKIALGFNLDDEKISDFFNGKILENLQNGIYFTNIVPKGHIGICNDIKLNGELSKMLVLGSLSKNYNYFYERIAA